MRYLFDHILFNDGWKSNTIIEVDNSGNITSIENSESQYDQHIKGYTIPGFQNAHSHAFQYAMAGLAEIHDSNNSDDFWSWRDAMYKLALSVSPNQIKSIAKMLYAEMLRHGYTNVAEFHYVHHDQNGRTYENLSETGEQLIEAAKETGINITLIPIFYQKGGFGKDPVEGQKRFISPTVEEYFKLLDASKKSCEKYEGANLAVGIHSMRGVEPTDIVRVAKEGPQDIPFHIHISEQLKEVKDSLNYLGKRPVEWLAENINLTDRFHLVHATHLTEDETKSIANSGANVVICPTTEGNLGDGIFPFRDYQSHKGQWSIGTDSHVGINPLEELRLLDYGQRLISHDRKTFAKSNSDSGAFAIDSALLSGRKAMNNYSTDYFKVGEVLNATTYSDDHILLKSAKEKNLLSTIVYTADATTTSSTISRGKLVVLEGKHLQNDIISNKFLSTLKELGNR